MVVPSSQAWLIPFIGDRPRHADQLAAGRFCRRRHVAGYQIGQAERVKCVVHTAVIVCGHIAGDIGCLHFEEIWGIVKQTWQHDRM